MKNGKMRRPRLALPFTILSGRDTVCLVAGEDFRYTLTGGGIELWLPDFLNRLDGRQPLDLALTQVADREREAAWHLVERLYGERVLVDGPPDAAHPATRFRLAVEGGGPLAEALAKMACEIDRGSVLRVLCQDRLDYDEALRFNRSCRSGPSPWLWVTSGPMSRGYVSPVFLPDAGPCLACLVRHFQRLSPVPAIYDDLLTHACQGRPIPPVPFPEQAVELLKQTVLWKASLLAEKEPVPALYRLHVLETESFEVSTHRVFSDPECPECAGDA